MMPWTLKRKVEEAGYGDLVRICLQSAAHEYARRIATKRYKAAAPSMTMEQFEASLYEKCPEQKERNFVCARVYAELADSYYWQEQNLLARRFYSLATNTDRLMPTVWVKRLLLAAGAAGDWIRRGRARRHNLHRAPS
jgi:hypothetical protein